MENPQRAVEGPLLLEWREAPKGSLLEARGVKTGQGERNDKGTSGTVREVAREAGVHEDALEVLRAALSPRSC